MNLGKIVLSAALLTLSTSAFAGAPTDLNDGSRSLNYGEGSKSCEATCIATCGTGIEAGTLQGEQGVIGWGNTDVEAYNRAAMGCRGINLGACFAPGNELVVEYVSGYRHIGDVKSRGMVVLRTTAATVDNCKPVVVKK